MREASQISIKDGENEVKVRITPMSASKAEGFMYRLLLGLDYSSLTGAKSMDAESLLGLINKLDYETAKPLLDDLLACCELVTPGGTVKITPETLDGMFDFFTSIVTLRLMAAKVSFGFFFSGGYQSFLTNLRGIASAV